MMRTRLPVLNRSTYCGVSLQALCQISCSFQSSSLPFGFSYQYIVLPGNGTTIKSGQPSPLRSSAQQQKLVLYNLGSKPSLAAEGRMACRFQSGASYQ